MVFGVQEVLTKFKKMTRYGKKHVCIHNIFVLSVNVGNLSMNLTGEINV